MWSMVAEIRLSEVALTVFALMVAHLIMFLCLYFYLFMRYIYTLSQYFSKYNYLGFLSPPSGYASSQIFCSSTGAKTGYIEQFYIIF